jgi:hypothetical protein
MKTKPKNRRRRAADYAEVISRVLELVPAERRAEVIRKVSRSVPRERKRPPGALSILFRV